MQTRRLGNSDMEITRLGLGAWAIGGPWQYGWGPQDDAASIRTIHAALDRGFNWIDTAPIYGLGHSEEIVGRALRETGASAFLFTKCGLGWDVDGNRSHALGRASIRLEMEDTLRRLGVDAVDLYQIHWPLPEADIDEACATLEELRQEGKARYVGVCNFNVAQLEQVKDRTTITSLQPSYSLVDRRVETEVLPYCRERGIGVINYSPMASGLLSGTMTRERIASLPADDWRRGSKQFQDPKLTRNLDLAALLGEVGESHGKSAGEVAIAWTLHNPAITGAIVGLRRPDQVAGVAGAAEIALAEADLERIDRFLHERS